MKTPDGVKRICASFFYDCLENYKEEVDAVNWAMDEIKSDEIKELQLFFG